MTYTIRAFNYDDFGDYKALEMIERDVFPDEFETAAEHQHMDKTNRAHFHRRFLALDNEQNEQPIGWASLQRAHWFDEPDQYVISGAVIAAHQGGGIGKQLYAALQSEMDAIAVDSLLSWVREDKLRGIQFLQDRGFVQKQRDAQSQLDVTTFDASRFAGIQEKMATQGVKLFNLVELAAIEPAWKQKIWEMRWPIRQDIPSSEEKKQIPYETWHTYTLESPTHDPRGYVVAIAPDGEYIGWSNIETSEGDPTSIWTGVTGVKRAWRRKGVATALKLAIIDYAKATGVKRIVTENEENNPMYDLNMLLGFKPIPGWLTMKKVVTDV